mgnify:FL=1
MNLPNKLTFLRIALIPLMLIFMLPLPFAAAAGWNHFIRSYGMIIALIVFCIASYTDHLDGSIARKRNIVTNLGKFLDPIADKLLIVSAFIGLTQLGLVSSWVPVIVLFREFSVTGIRLLAIEQGRVIAASKLGKFKMVTQIIAVISLMLKDLFLTHFTHYILRQCISVIAGITVTFAVVMTLLSGADYLKRNIGLLKN